MKKILIVLFLFGWVKMAGAQIQTEVSSSANGDLNLATGSTALNKWVMGSGGLTFSNSAKMNHKATAGETCIGSSSSMNYRLAAGFWQASSPIATQIMLDNGESLPREFSLSPCYPNPFNPQTTIEFALPKACWIGIEIYNELGQQIYQFPLRYQGPGKSQVTWYSLDGLGRPVGSGVYLCRIMAVADRSTVLFQQIEKMVLIR